MMPQGHAHDQSTDRLRHDSTDGLLTGMQPAFRHAKTGESHLAQLEPGVPAQVYGFAGLPNDWIVERDRYGNAIALHPDVIAGYWRAARFIALAQLANMPHDD